jgi:hypothetical protein
MSGLIGSSGGKTVKSGGGLIGLRGDSLLTASAAIRPDFGLRHGG